MSFLKHLFKFGLGIIQTLEAAFVMTFFWKWFITPTFHLREIHLMEAVGLSLFWSLLNVNQLMAYERAQLHMEDPEAKETHDLYQSVGMIVLFYPIMFGVAYVYHLFM